MCFRNIQQSIVCQHWVVRDIIPCDVQRRKPPMPWFKKIRGGTEPEHCGSVKAIELPEPEPNLCPKCIDKRLRSSGHINKTESPVSKGETLVRPGPAQRKLSETCGTRAWDQNIDWDTLEKQEEGLRKRIAAVDEAARQKKLAAIKAAPHPHASSTGKNSGPTADKQTGTTQHEQVKGHHEGPKRRNADSSGGYTQPRAATLPVSETGMNRQGVDWEVLEDYARSKRKTSRTYTSPRLPLSSMEAPRETRDEIFDNLAAQLERQDLGRTPTAKQHRPLPTTREWPASPLYRGEHPNVASARHLAEHDYQRRKDQEPGLVDPSTVPVDTSWQSRTYSGPVVGAAWVKLAKDLYPEGDPLAQWRDKEVSLPNTSAVPNPLAVQNSLLAKYGVQEPHSRGRSQTRSRPRAPVKPPKYNSQMSEYYSYLDDEDDSSPSLAATLGKEKGNGTEPRIKFSLPPNPRHTVSHVRSKDDEHDNYASSPRSAPTPVKPSRERKTVSMGSAPPTQRNLSYFAMPVGEGPQYRQPSEDDIHRCELGESKTDSEKVRKPGKSRPRTLSIPKRVSSVKGPDSSVSWKSASSTASSSSAKQWLKSKLGLSDDGDTASFRCKDAADIEGRR